MKIRATVYSSYVQIHAKAMGGKDGHAQETRSKRTAETEV